MKPQWLNLKKSIDEHADHLQVFVENVKDPKTIKNLKTLASGYNKILAITDEFDKLVEPIAPIIANLPFKTPEFAESWTFYKEYLLEQHHVYLSSRCEQWMLNKLSKFATKKQERAIDILEFLVINRYKSFFCPSEKQLAGEELPVTETSATASIDLNVDKSKRV